MSRRRLCFVFAVIVTSLSGAGYSQTPRDRIQETPSASNANVPTPPIAKPWDDWLVVQGNQHVPVVDELGRNFQRARESFLQMNFQTAAEETRKAAAFLTEQMDSASKQEGQKIGTTITSLNLLAQQLERQSVESLEQIDAVFIRAHQADMEHSWVLVGAEKWRRLAVAPQAHFRLAEQAVRRQEFQVAATEIRKAAGLLKLEDTRRTHDNQELASSVQALTQLAAQVAKGSANVQDLNSPFARAEFDLAASHCSNAIQALTQKELQAAGHELQAGVLDLAQGAEWAGRGAEFDSSFVVTDALALSEKLIERQAGVSAEIAREIRTVGNEIASLTKELPQRPASPVWQNDQAAR